MISSICGADCGQCGQRASCGGCAGTGGHPFGRPCMLAECARGRGQTSCEACGGACVLKAPVIAAFNALGIGDMAEVTDLNALQGSYINLTYTLPNGQTVRLLEDGKVYLGNQLHREGTDRCYGLAADETHLLVCEYGDGGADPEIVVYKKWRR